jgi:dUTPase
MIEGGYVVLYYNPRPEENSEIQVRANQPRMVWTGYSFMIPEGYVADIWSAGRCVASFAESTGDGDFRIPVLGTSDAGLAVATGREVARLTLRRIEPVAVSVDRGGFGG